MALQTVKKVKSASALVPILRSAQRQGKKVVFTNGCFDLVHAGHVTLLERCKRQGDLLCVGINSDRSTRALKGPGRPIVSQRYRARLLAALACVDYVTVFTGSTPLSLIRKLRPNVLIKGADWGRGEIVGADDVQSWGGRVVRIPLVKGLSTSALIKRIQRGVR